mmetsp:Transcript_22541/g.33717  ORF Transcript_22541/g.33717 Transcript_22541/m.33717 type:complete len:987 (+) Transcript_22541:373-3333(+)
MNCTALEEKEQCYIEDIGVLKSKLKEKERELENLACGIEMARLEKQKEKYKEELEKKKKRMQKNRGLIAWLFDYMFGGSSGGVGSEDDTDDEIEKLQDLARSTLLHALQTERNNVDELEAALSATQQNNSAIAEMVSSRDLIIDELNDRVAVFEEDKVVLKAALRQLQKEMKEEAPKTQKLVMDLETARKDIQKLEDNIDELKSNHTDEIVALEEQILEKEDMINETDSKMSMISVYVDQLEERLASFAVARRDITLREEVCKEIEEREIQKRKEYVIMEKQMKEALSSRDELKAVSDLMSQERAQLQKERDGLIIARDNLLDEEKSLRHELRVLSDNFSSYEAELKSTQHALEEAQAFIAQKDENINQLKELNEESSLKLEEQRESLEQSAVLSSSLQEEVERLEDENQRVSALVSALENRVEEVVSETEQRFSRQVAQVAVEAEKIAEAEKVAAETAAAAENMVNQMISEAEKEASAKIAEAEELAAQRMADAEEMAAQRIAEAEKAAAQRIAEAEEVAKKKIAEAEMLASERNLEDIDEDEEVPPLNDDAKESDSKTESIEIQGWREVDIETEDVEDNFMPPPPPPPLNDSDDNDEILNDDVIPPPPPPPPLPDTDDEYETGTEFMTDNSEPAQVSDSETNDTEMMFGGDDLPPPPPPSSLVEETYADRNDFEADTPPPPPPPQLEETLASDEDQIPEYIPPEGSSWDKEIDETEFNVEAAVIHHPPGMADDDASWSTTEDISEEKSTETIIEDESSYVTQDLPGDGDEMDFNASAEVDGDESLQDDTNGAGDLEIDDVEDNSKVFNYEIEAQDLDDDLEIISDDIEIISDDESENPPEISDGKYENYVITDNDDKSECETEPLTVVDEDDLEIISDDEPELPPDYFEDHLDDEEKHKSFFDDEKEEEDEEKNKEDDAVDEGAPEIPEDETETLEQGELVISPPSKRRRVPFRKVRKTLAFLTGVHGLFTPPSRDRKSLKQKK